MQIISCNAAGGIDTAAGIQNRLPKNPLFPTAQCVKLSSGSCFVLSYQNQMFVRGSLSEANCSKLRGVRGKGRGSGAAPNCACNCAVLEKDKSM